MIRRLQPGGPFDVVATDVVERARVVPVRFLQPGVDAMTVGRFILVRRDRLEDRALLAHELVHVRQWRDLGAVRFLLRYVAAYLRARRRGLGHWDAYRAVPFEAEARELAGR